MYQMMILTHGSLAQGLQETLQMFTPEAEQVMAISLKEDGVDAFRAEVAAAAAACCSAGEELLVFVDVFGGTPFNTAMLEIKAKYPGSEVVAGVNLPMLMEAALARRHNNLADVLPAILDAGRQSVVLAETAAAAADDE